mmetsp:Transcript_7107/g.16246  ORF Transcript_7107/g.16246 Transcript_7107/m.16246 type:complete len:298 (-) Transcript_7107:1419-2312(-)
MGDLDARSLNRRRGARGKLRILKTLLCECAATFPHPLNLFFFDERHKVEFEKMRLESGDMLPFRIQCRRVVSLDEMPHHEARKSRRRKRGRTSTQQQGVVAKYSGGGEEEPTCNCFLCQHHITPDQEALTCCACFKTFHELCVELLDYAPRCRCPSCLKPADWQLDDSDSSSHDSGEDRTNTTTTLMLDAADSSETTAWATRENEISGPPNRSKAPKGGGAPCELEIPVATEKKQPPVWTLSDESSASALVRTTRKPPPPYVDLTGTTSSSPLVSSLPSTTSKPHRRPQIMIDLCSP